MASRISVPPPACSARALHGLALAIAGGHHGLTPQRLGHMVGDNARLSFFTDHHDEIAAAPGSAGVTRSVMLYSNEGCVRLPAMIWIVAKRNSPS